MKHLILIALIITSASAFAGKKTCKAYVSDRLSSEEKELGLTYYDYVDVLASVGYEVTTDKDEADLKINMGYGTLYRCSHGINSRLGLAIDNMLSSEGAASIHYENVKTGKYEWLDKYVYRNPTRNKVMKKLYKLASKLPKCH